MDCYLVVRQEFVLSAFRIQESTRDSIAGSGISKRAHSVFHAAVRSLVTLAQLTVHQQDRSGISEIADRSQHRKAWSKTIK